MAQLEYDLQPLFVEPIFRCNIGHAITRQQEDFIKKLPMLQNQTNLISDNLYIFDLPELASIKAAMQEVLDLYADKVLGISQQLYVTQSWSLTNAPGQGMHGHSHSNSIVSGSLYYTDLPDPPARMIFDRHRTYQQIQLNAEQGRQTLFNTRINVIEPKKHDVILFSSDLQHLVEPNQSQLPRHCIAFNTFVRGTLGDYRDVCELKLS